MVLPDVAAALKLPLNKVEKFTRSGGGPLGNTAPLVEAVFSLEVLEDGENTSVIELSEGRAVVAHVDKYSPSHGEATRRGQRGRSSRAPQ